MKALNEVPVRRESLGAQVRAFLIDAILEGRLPPDERINEVQLAEELKVSRTPLRQALTQLEGDGLVVADPGRGWFVTPLTVEEAHELYPILGVLEATALRATRTPKPAVLDDLERINRRLAAVGDDPERAIAENSAWHERLLAPCPNGRLARLVRSHWNQTRRYEFAFFAPGAARVRQSAALHEGIMGALRAGRLDDACRLMEEHWLTDLDHLLPLIEDAGPRAASP